VTSPTATVDAGADRFFGPFPDDYNQPDDTGTVLVDLSAVSSVSVACLTL
jgi:hypothetical protein